MKSNWALRIAGLALVLTLVTSSLVAGTYAKYTTAVAGTDTARVAKFAFNLNGATQAVDTMTFALFDHTDANTLTTDGTTKLIAPGTEGTVELKIENLSEVAVGVTLALDETNDNDIPIYYTINDTTQRYSAVLEGDYGSAEGAGTYKALADLKTDMETALAGTLEAKTGETAPSKDIDLNWTWAFNTAGTGQTDTDDTILGITGTAAVELEVTATVTQVD